MKFTALIAGLLLFLGQCDTDESSAKGKCFKVSFVNGICLDAVLKIEDPAFYEYGETSEGMSNVFMATFPCGTDWDLISAATPESGKTFFVEITPQPDEPTCVRCKATVAYEGEKRVFARVTDSRCNPVQ